MKKSRISNRFNELLARKERIEGREILRQEVADVTGLGMSTLYAYSKQRVTRYDAKVLEALCSYFECGLSDLLVLDDESDQKTPSAA